MRGKVTELTSFHRLPGGDNSDRSTGFGSSPSPSGGGAYANRNGGDLPVSRPPGEFGAFGMSTGAFAPDRDTSDIFTDRDLLLDANQMRYLRRRTFLCFDITSLS